MKGGRSGGKEGRDEVSKAVKRNEKKSKLDKISREEGRVKELKKQTKER